MSPPEPTASRSELGSEHKRSLAVLTRATDIIRIRSASADEGEYRSSALQGWVLISCGWLSVMAGVMLSPVLPTMTQVFHAQEHVDVLISLTATLPALLVALLSWPFGVLGDHIGHKRLLVWSTALYGVLGTAPAWLQSLPLIVVSRGLVGVAEAAIMTCSTTLIGGLFSAERRERYFALQTGSAPLAAMCMLAVGGALGQSSWHRPFLAYGFGFVLLPLAATLVREPLTLGVSSTRRSPDATDATAAPSPNPTQTFKWGRLIWICAITCFAMSAFYVTLIQMGFVLSERGLISPGQIGFWSSIAALANPVGALVFGLLHWRPQAKLAMCFTLISTGLFMIALLPGWQLAVAGGVVVNFGCGMILPTLVTWAITMLPEKQRGSGTGVWMAASFLGQFLSPLAVLGLKHFSGSLSGAILLYAIACGFSATAAIASLCVGWSRRS